MAVRVVETDFDTKGKTIRTMDRIQRTMPNIFEHALFRWWQKVYFRALREVPIDTAALRATIRIKRKESNVGKYNVGRTTDVKTVFISHMFANGESHRSGLAKSLIRLGMQFKGKKHNAKDDALNTFLIYRELLQLMERMK